MQMNNDSTKHFFCRILNDTHSSNLFQSRCVNLALHECTLQTIEHKSSAKLSLKYEISWCNTKCSRKMVQFRCTIYMTKSRIISQPRQTSHFRLVSNKGSSFFFQKKIFYLLQFTHRWIIIDFVYKFVCAILGRSCCQQC